MNVGDKFSAVNAAEQFRGTLTVTAIEKNGLGLFGETEFIRADADFHYGPDNRQFATYLDGSKCVGGKVNYSGYVFEGEK